jgi:hypothetical protein
MLPNAGAGDAHTLRHWVGKCCADLLRPPDVLREISVAFMYMRVNHDDEPGTIREELA